MQWFVQPETVQVALPGGQWMVLKKRLTIGEQRAAFALLVKEYRGDGSIVQNPETVGMTSVVAYLVDWSLTSNGKPVPVETDGQKLAAVRSLDVEAFRVIQAAVDEHVNAMAGDREKEKKAAGETAS